jgi:four helix bundle protein
MSKIERFEDIKAWQLARGLVTEIYKITNSKNCSKDYGFKDQIQRSAVSIMSNIAEGFERYNKKELIQFFNFARGSAGETRSHLYIALDLGYISKEDFARLKDACESISRHIWNFMKYLKSSESLNV